jgi:PAS domain S-box-containing protein
LSTAIGIVGYAYFTRQMAASREAEQTVLGAVAELKIQDICERRAERLADAQAIMRETSIGQQVEKFLSGPPDRPLRARLLAWLESMRERHQDLREVLLDRQGHARLAFPEDNNCLGPTAEGYATEALRAKHAIMSDLHRGRFSGQIHMDVAVPLFSSPALSKYGESPAGDAGVEPVGVLVAELDPGRLLYPHLQKRPTASSTAETLLVRREGDDVVYLNELRHLKNAPLGFRLPLDKQPSLVAAMAVMGKEGLIEGTDYRHVPVLAAVRHVPGTPWFMVAKVDQEEVYAPLRARTLITGAVVVALLLAAFLAVGLLSRRRENRWLRCQLAIEGEHRLILDSTDQGVLGLDSQGTHVFVNPAACRMVGYQPEELIGKPGHAIWHHTRADGTPYPSHECPICQALKTGNSCRGSDEVFWRKNGDSFPVEYIATPSVEKDQPIAMVLFIRDITERKRTEDALKKSEEDYRLMVQNALSAVAVHSIVLDACGKPIDYVFLSVNPAFEQHTGLRAKDVIGRRATEVLPGVEDTRLIEIFGGVAITGESASFELHAEAMGRYYLVNAYRVAEGQVAAAFMDITERKLAEQALVESEQRLRCITDAARDAIVMMDSRGTVSYWNSAAESLFGHSRAEAIGKDVHELLATDESAAAHRTAFPEFARTGRGKAIGKKLELAARRKDGQEITVDLSLSPVSLNGEWHAVGILRDITERKRAERLQEQYMAALENQKQAMEELWTAAESATRAKSEFLANMSHEIRTPMTAIVGYADILAEGLENPEHLEAVNTIRRNGAYLLEIINGILDLSKIEAGKLQVERIACAPGTVLAEAASLMRVRADAKGLALKLEYAGACPETISTDPARLRQILINLIGNAIKFTTAGEVRVVVRLVDGDSSQPRLACDIVDTGIGMTSEQVERLFQPFSQADGSTSRKFGGTGLGLVISKRLAEMLGGDIRVTSAPGQGSTFTLTVDTGPLSGVALLAQPGEAVAAPSPVPPRGPRPSLKCRILLAEDGPDNQRLIAFLLKKAGAEVALAENGQIACDKALAARDRDTPFDVILMDMQMPVMDGYEAARRLREKGYSGPIVALTAHAMADDRQRCLEAGCNDYATKPIDRDQLIGMMARITGEAGGASPPPAPLLYSRLAADPDLAELVDMFVEEMPGRMTAIRSQAEARNWAQLGRTAHQLKGSAGSYGFPQITLCAARLEAAAKNAHPEERILAAVEELLTLCRNARSGVPPADPPVAGAVAPQESLKETP